jgi:3',5'-cyclic AMP phosphodiesterase CpdA
MRLMIVSDSHLAAEARAFEPNWHAVRRFAGAAGVNATIHLGDVTLDAVSDSSQLGYARDAIRDWPTPIQFVPGNHDVGDNPWGPGIPNDHPFDVDRLSAYRACFGADYWSLDLGGWSIIGLDAQLLGTDTEEEAQQWAWLVDRVARVGKRRSVIAIHKPLFQNDVDDSAPHVRYVPIESRRRLLDLVAPLDLRLVLSGHTHQSLDRTIRGTRHVWVPSSAFVFPDTMQETIGAKTVGVGLLDLTADGWRFEVTCPEGMTQYVFAAERLRDRGDSGEIRDARRQLDP